MNTILIFIAVIALLMTAAGIRKIILSKKEILNYMSCYTQSDRDEYYDMQSSFEGRTDRYPTLEDREKSLQTLLEYNQNEKHKAAWLIFHGIFICSAASVLLIVNIIF